MQALYHALGRFVYLKHILVFYMKIKLCMHYITHSGILSTYIANCCISYENKVMYAIYHELVWCDPFAYK